MYVRVLADEGHLSQYSKTSFRIWGVNAACPLAGYDLSCALNSGLNDDKLIVVNSEQMCGRVWLDRPAQRPADLGSQRPT